MKNFNALLFLLPILFISCEKELIEGPSLNDLYGELSIIEPFLVLGDSFFHSHFLPLLCLQRFLSSEYFLRV